MGKRLAALLLFALLATAAPAFGQTDDSDKDDAGGGTAVLPNDPFDQGVEPRQGDTPTRGALYQEGADGKYLVGGRWFFRLDPADEGLRAGFARAAATEGWSQVGIPHVWNATDLTPTSMLGSVGWYRKDFRTPRDRRALGWALRFESANYRLRAWLNGRPIGEHEGAYLPFELAAKGIAPPGRMNRLVVRIDSRTTQFDLPPGGPDETGEPDGGWWNYGGLPREVYLRRVAAGDFDDVLVRSDVECLTCAADVRVVVRARNTTDSTRRMNVLGTFGRHELSFSGPRRLAPGRQGIYRARLRLDDPVLWSPGNPALYVIRLRLNAGGLTRPAWFVRHGIRMLRVKKGILHLNGRPVRLRGASLHEDDPEDGSALTQARRLEDVKLLQRLGATITRAHYPVHPYTLELLDRFGIFFWNQAPVYQLRAPQLGSAPLRRKSVEYMSEQVLRDRNHASVLAWSIVNELPARPGSGQEALIGSMSRAVRALDPTRLVALDIQGYPTVGPQEAYRELDALGINDYFGWYPGPNGTIADRRGLGPYLDELRSAYPEQALFITEFGAEANRDGPLDEKGTYAFQRDLLRYHLREFDKRAFINGALVWILRDFRVKPGWEGGNPKPEPPVNFKGLVTQDGKEKPAFGEIARLFRATRQIR